MPALFLSERCSEVGDQPVLDALPQNRSCSHRNRPGALPAWRSSRHQRLPDLSQLSSSSVALASSASPRRSSTASSSPPRSPRCLLVPVKDRHRPRRPRHRAGSATAAQLMGVNVQNMGVPPSGWARRWAGAAGALVAPIYYIYPQWAAPSPSSLRGGGPGREWAASSAPHLGGVLIGVADRCPRCTSAPAGRTSASTSSSSSCCSSQAQRSIGKEAGCESARLQARWPWLVLRLVPLWIQSPYAAPHLHPGLPGRRLGESWNVIGGYAGQYSVGHSAWYGIRRVWRLHPDAEQGNRAWKGVWVAVAIAVLVALAVAGSPSACAGPTSCSPASRWRSHPAAGAELEGPDHAPKDLLLRIRLSSSAPP